MILIWRGLGGMLTAIMVLFAFVFPMTMRSGGSYTGPLLQVALGLLAAAGCWFIGRRLNVIGPRERAMAGMAERERQVRTAVENGTFAPGGIRPTSLEQARQQGEAMLAQEREAASRPTNRHTLFFIPMQWWAVVCLLIALMGLVATVQMLLT